MNDPEPKHSPLCFCRQCRTDREFTPSHTGDEMRSVLAFHAIVTTPETLPRSCDAINIIESIYFDSVKGRITAEEALSELRTIRDSTLERIADVVASITKGDR